MSEQSPSVGQILAHARQTAGLTTQQVSDATRIRRAIIDGIERDDHALAGGAVYARGHIRAIAGVLGIDAAPLLAQLTAEATPHAVIERPIEGAAEPIEKAAPPGLTGLAGIPGTTTAASRSGPNWSAVMAAALAVIVVVVGFQFVRSSGSGGGAVAGVTPSPSGTSSAPPSPTATATAPVTPPASPSPSTPGDNTVATATGVRVVVAVTAKSWVSVTASQQTVYEGLLRAGDTRTFTDKKKVKLSIGNAGGVDLTVNGRHLGAPGAAGKVVTVSFGPGDPSISQA